MVPCLSLMQGSRSGLQVSDSGNEEGQEQQIVEIGNPDEVPLTSPSI
jgi:hypothetical protein